MTDLANLSSVVTTEIVPNSGLVAISMLVPSVIGAKIYVRLPDTYFRRIVLVLLTMSGLAFMASTGLRR